MDKDLSIFLIGILGVGSAIVDKSGLLQWAAEVGNISLWLLNGLSVLLMIAAVVAVIGFVVDKGLHIRRMAAEDKHRQNVMSLKLAAMQAEIISNNRHVALVKNGHDLVLIDHTNGLQIVENKATALPDGGSRRHADGEHGNQHGYFDLEAFVAQLGEATTYNLRITGDTQRGKTTLVLNLLAEIIKPLREAEIWVIDPKYLPHKHKGKWGNLSVACKDIERVLPTLEHIDRHAFAPRLSADHPPCFVVVDECDWLYSDYGADYLDYINQWAKVGSEAGFYVWVIGQSALVKTSGIDTALQQNFNHIALGKSAYQAVKQAETVADKAERDAILSDLRAYQQQTKFFGVFSQGGEWAAFKTPPLRKPNIITSVDVAALPSPPLFDLATWLADNPVSQVGRADRPDRVLFLAGQGVDKLADIVTACYRQDGTNQRNYVIKILEEAGYTIADGLVLPCGAV